MSPIKDLTVTYEAVNPEDTFSAGDTVTGTVSFTLTKEVTVQELLVKLKGEAYVRWSQGSGKQRKTYSASRRYFKEKVNFLGENEKGNVLQEGAHHYNFRLRIPQGDMPPSFRGVHGKIVYMIEAKLSRKWHFSTKNKKELHFVCKYPQQPVHPLTGSVNKETGVFTRGEVKISATVDKNVYSPGETVFIDAKVNNSSSKEMRPKFSLNQKIVFHASDRTKCEDHKICKEVGNQIPPNSEENVACKLTIPQNTFLTMHNCEIITVEYYIKVSLDISFEFDPKVVFPITIVPSGQATNKSAPGPSYSDFPAPGFPIEPAGAGAFGPPAPYPANMASGFTDPIPQQAPPHDFLNAAFPPAPGQYSATTTPSFFQHGDEPPSYTSIYPPSVSGSADKS